MAILKASHSKATPIKGLAYILDPKKVEAWGCVNLDTSSGADPRYLGEQMMETQHLHRQGRRAEERKYYHYKISFAPDDRSENGGKLTPELAAQIAKEFVEKHLPGREAVWSIQGDGAARHVHIIVNAVDLQTGRKLEVSDAEWRRWKDDCQDLCREYGLQALDWRQAIRDKRAHELDPDEPVIRSKAEEGLLERGERSWKEDLRDIIDAAATSCLDFDGFRAQLRANGVELTRCSDTMISYKLGEHKAVRGDKLGGDYTAAAIRDALQHNARQPAPAAGKEHAGIDALVGHAARRHDLQVAGERDLDLDARNDYRAAGRMMGVLRSEIDFHCDQAEAATWEEKQGVWAEAKEVKELFWREYGIMQQRLREQISEQYKELRKVRQAEWILDPRNRRSGVVQMIFAAIYMRKHEYSTVLRLRIQRCKEAQTDLRLAMMDFKWEAQKATETLREKGLSLDEYEAAIRSLQDLALKMRGKTEDLALTEEERASLQKRAAAAREKRQQSRSGPER